MKPNHNCPLCPFVLRIAEMLNNEGVSQRTLAQRGGIPRHQVDAIMSGLKAPTYEFCRAIAEVFKLPLTLLLHQAGLLPIFGDSPQEKLIDHQLTTLSKEPSPEQSLLFVEIGPRTRSDSLTTQLLDVILKKFTNYICEQSLWHHSYINLLHKWGAR